MVKVLDGKVAIITGAASGIGRSAAELFVDAGAIVVLADLLDSDGEALASALSQNGQAQFVATDVSDSEQVDRLVGTTAKIYGRIDCAVNNAGVAAPHDLLHEISQSDWRRQVEINLEGVWHCMRAELRQMYGQDGSASIVNISSLAGVAALPRSAPYSAVKHAVIGLTRTAALDYAEHGIRVNAVCPGTTETPMVERRIAASGVPREEMLARFAASVPMGRAARSDEPAQAALWLCSEQSSFVTGQAIVVDGGRSLAI